MQSRIWRGIRLRVLESIKAEGAKTSPKLHQLLVEGGYMADENTVRVCLSQAVSEGLLRRTEPRQCDCCGSRLTQYELTPAGRVYIREREVV